MAIHHIRQGDTDPPFRTRLFDNLGNPVDLSGAVVRFHATVERTLTAKIDALAVVEPDQIALRGYVDYNFTSVDTDTAGRYWAEWEVTYPDAGIQTFPTRGHDTLLVYGELIA